MEKKNKKSRQTHGHKEEQRTDKASCLKIVGTLPTRPSKKEVEKRDGDEGRGDAQQKHRHRLHF